MLNKTAKASASRHSLNLLLFVSKEIEVVNRESRPAVAEAACSTEGGGAVDRLPEGGSAGVQHMTVLLFYIRYDIVAGGEPRGEEGVVEEAEG